MSNVKNLRIQTIRRAGTSAAQRQKNPLAVGNVLINGQWFSGIEIRNDLLGIGMSPDLLLPSLTGCNMTYREINITQEMLDAGGGQHVEYLYKTETSPGREVIFKKVGKTNVELAIDFSTWNVTENTINMNKLVAVLGSSRVRQQAPVRTAPANTETLIEEPGELGALPDVAPLPGVLKDPVNEAHQELNN